MATPMSFPFVTPESQGIDSRALLHVLDDIQLRAHQHCEIHDMLILRHGKLVYEGYWWPFTKTTKHPIFSETKSFMSTAIGLAIDAKLLSLDDTICSFFPEITPQNPSMFKSKMRVRDLLSMAGGQDQDTMNEIAEGGPQAYLDVPVVYEPGTHFLYNTGSSHMLATICEKVTGMSLYDWLKPRVFDKIGIGIQREDWMTINGVCSGGFGLEVCAMDVLRLANLYLRGGEWNGEQVIPAWWVKECASKKIDCSSASMPSWNSGYTFQFWMCDYADAYRIDGFAGQQANIIPSKDMVILFNASLHGDKGDYAEVLARHFILPGVYDEALPENPSAQAALYTRRDALLAPTARPFTPFPEALAGKYVCQESGFPLPHITLVPQGAELRVDFPLPNGPTVSAVAGLDGLPRVTDIKGVAENIGDALRLKADWNGQTLCVHLNVFPSVENLYLRMTFGSAPAISFAMEAMDFIPEGKLNQPIPYQKA